MANDTDALADLTERIEKVEGILRKLVPYIQQLAQQSPEQTQHEVDNIPPAIYQRYKNARKQNRQVQEHTDVIAIFMHYFYHHNITARTIVSCGLLSQSKAYGLSSWDKTFVDDFMVVHGVVDIYNNASSMPELADKYPAMAKLNQQINK